MCAIEIMAYIFGSITLVVDRCDNISALRRETIHPEAVKSSQKRVYLISCLYAVYQWMDYRIYLVHVYGHQNTGRLASIFTPLASLNVTLDALAENIMVAFLLSSATRNTITIGLLDPHRIPSVSIHRSPVHSSIAHTKSMRSGYSNTGIIGT